MKIYSIYDEAFKKYGQALDAPYYKQLKEAAKGLSLPVGATAYNASEAVLEEAEVLDHYSQHFGGLDVQIGYCRGENHLMNALEWHKSSEIAVALSDMILLLGDIRDMQNKKYDSSHLEAFRLKEGESIELWATTLHFCPISIGDTPFRNVVILPRGTNTPLDPPSDDKRLISKNKWLIIHPQFKAQLALGRDPAIIGENIKI